MPGAGAVAARQVPLAGRCHRLSSLTDALALALEGRGRWAAGPGVGVESRTVTVRLSGGTTRRGQVLKPCQRPGLGGGVAGRVASGPGASRLRGTAATDSHRPSH